MPQSLSSVLVHLVFSTKNRIPLISAEIEPELHAFVGGIARDCGCSLLAAGGVEDHCHLLCSLSRTISISTLMEELKTRSSKWIKTKGVTFSGFHWQNGYGAFSIGQSQVNSLKAYFAVQKTHHKKVSFQDEFRVFLRKYEITFDERYMWD
jgi:putative transposase